MKTKTLILLTILSLSLIPFVKADSTQWVDSSFQYRNIYAIDSSLIDEKLYDFPVLVYLNSSYIQWDRVNDNLSDLRFYNASNNLLSHELQEDYTVNDEAWLWVKIPYISNISDTYFYMYYGCFYAESVENKTDVWVDYAMVQHMNDATTSTILDSTVNSNDGTKKAANEPIETTGKIGNAQDFDGTDDSIEIANEANFDMTDYITIEGWIYNSDFGSSANFYKTLFSKRNTAFECYIYGKTDWVFQADRAVAGIIRARVANVFSSGWYYVVFRFDKDNQDSLGNYHSLFVNGQIQSLIWIDGSDTNEVFQTNNELPNIGSRMGVTLFADLKEDEVRVSNVARSSAWVGASYETQRLNLISLTNTETFNEDYLAFGVIAIIIAMFSFVMVITYRRKEK